MTFGLLLSRTFALGLFGLALWEAWRFPVYAQPLAIGFALYALALVVEVRVWLLVLPAAIAVLSLGFWSGRYFWDALDLFMLVTVAGGLWASAPWRPQGDALKRLWPILVFVLVQATVTLNGLYPLETPVEGLWADYYASTNALREAKGVLWVLLLVPMLMQAQRVGGGAAKWLVGGVAIGLFVLGLAILWERNLYTGIFNFDSPYRVSGWFFDLHTGGAAIDVALAMMLPFVVGLWVWWKDWPVHVAMAALVCLGLYGLFVTFSRADYPAVAASVLVLLIGLLTLPGLVRRHRHGSGIKVYVLGGLAALLLGPLIIGGTIAERFKTTSQDLQVRLDHWQTSLSLVNPGTEHWLGIGKGAFPRRYHLAQASEGEGLSTLFRHQEGGKAYVHFSGSDRHGSLDLRQRFRPSGQRVRLRLVARTAPGTKERLLIEFCERHVLRVRPECDWVGINIPDTQGEWSEYNKVVGVGGLGRGGWLDRSPVDISILNRGIKGGLDIASVRLIDNGGQDLLANTDFSRGMDHWFMVDGNHLRWHVKNIFVYAYVEGGILGLGALVVLLVMALARCWRLHRAGDPIGVLFAAAIAAGLAIGLFDSILDAPRVTVLMLLPVFGALVWRPEPVAVAARFFAYPDWMPRPAVVVVGLAGLLVVTLGVRQVLSNRLSFSQSVLHYGEKLGLDQRFLFDLVDSSAGDRGAEFVLVPADRLPRVWRDVVPAGDEVRCDKGGLGQLAVCWAVKRDLESGSRALSLLQQMWDEKPQSFGEYGNGWLLALGYDLLSDHPAMTPKVRGGLQARLQRALRHYLVLLDSDDPAVWHGRTTLAAQAMMIAAELEVGDEHTSTLVGLAHYHYLQLLNALSVSEAWPEGYNYWVNSRGFLVALAGYSYLNAFPDARGIEVTRRVFSRLGLWHVYNTRPDIKAIQIADEGPRIDLREETQRIIDALVLTTDDPWLSLYSALLEQTFGRQGYYRSYRWLRPLLRRARNVVEPSPPADWMLPEAAWFGPGATNLFYLRSDWGDDATVVSYRAGSSLSHHGHYDAGHFTLFKGTPLAVTGSTYSGLGDRHRVDYGVRTVSKNSLLVMRPGEEVRPDGYQGENVADGGQRLTMPIRNPLSTLESWRANIDSGLHLEGGRILTYRDEPTSFTYIDSDITRAYNTPGHDEGGEGGKVSLVTRRLLYLRRLDRILIRDRVVATDPAYRAKWLLQSLVRPDIERGITLKGAADNGIVSTEQPEFRFANGRGRLQLLSMLPQRRETLLIGGRDYRFYTDVDGDAATLDGQNMDQGARVTPWSEPALWRLEISDRGEGREQEFLTLLSPSVEEFHPAAAQLVSAEPGAQVVVQVDDEVIVFVESQDTRGVVIPDLAGVSLVRVLGLPAGASVAAGAQRREATAEGTLTVEAPQLPLTLSWSAPRALGKEQAIR